MSCTTGPQSGPPPQNVSGRGLHSWHSHLHFIDAKEKPPGSANALPAFHTGSLSDTCAGSKPSSETATPSILSLLVQENMFLRDPLPRCPTGAAEQHQGLCVHGQCGRWKHPKLPKDAWGEASPEG